MGKFDSPEKSEEETCSHACNNSSASLSVNPCEGRSAVGQKKGVPKVLSFGL